VEGSGYLLHCSRGGNDGNLRQIGLHRGSNPKLPAEQIIVMEYRGYAVLISAELLAMLTEFVLVFLSLKTNTWKI
jgi:hypothetical protein